MNWVDTFFFYSVYDIYQCDSRACSSYRRFILRVTRLSNKLLEQGYVKERLKTSLRNCYDRYGDFFKQYEVPVLWMLNDILCPDHLQRQPTTDQILHKVATL